MNFQREACYLSLMNQWLIRYQRGWPIENFFIHRCINTVAIYGMGLYGRHLIRDLGGSSIKVSYAIDRKKKLPYEGVIVYQLDAQFPSVDAVIYSVLEGTDSIRLWLKTKFDCPIYSIEEVVFSDDEYES